jgi:hypothetical protein
MSGVKRNLENKARKMLDMFPILAILGARQVEAINNACPIY